MNSIQVRGSSGSTYTIKGRPGATPYCDCPAWRNQSKPNTERLCKHITGLSTEERESLTAAGTTPANRSGTEQGGPPPVVDTSITPGLLTSYAPGLDPTQWVAEPKLDGMRLLVHITDGKVRAYSRGETVRGVGSRDGFLVALEEGLRPWLLALDDTVLDGEAVIWENGKPPAFRDTMVVMGSGRDVAVAKQRRDGRHVSFACFDVLRLKGVDTRHLPYDERRLLLTQIGALKVDHLIIVPSMVVADMGGFDAAYDRMVELVEEGAVFKRLGSRYPSGRSADWLRRKAVFDLDVVITGFELAKPGKFAGMIGAVLFSQWKDGVLTERGKCSGMTDAMRRELTDNFEKYRGKVLTITYNGVLAAGGLRHPQWDRLRSDKPAEECIWE